MNDDERLQAHLDGTAMIRNGEVWEHQVSFHRRIVCYLGGYYLDGIGRLSVDSYCLLSRPEETTYGGTAVGPCTTPEGKWIYTEAELEEKFSKGWQKVDVALALVPKDDAHMANRMRGLEMVFGQGNVSKQMAKDILSGDKIVVIEKESGDPV